MSSRVELLNRVDGSAMSPFLLCNLLARRTRQLASARHAVLFSELVNEVLREFFEGGLKYEPDGRRPHSTPSLVAPTAVENEQHPSDGGMLERTGRRLPWGREEPNSAPAVLRRG
jgi:hypothetical protein